jgi:hypothetical protein
MNTEANRIALRRVKVAHTVIWAFFAASIVAIPMCSLLEQHRAALLLIAIVAAEVLVLVVNQMSCPLTAVARRYTDDPRDNFDIYLPEWLARHNKAIFGWLYAAGVVLTLVRLP